MNGPEALVAGGGGGAGGTGDQDSTCLTIQGTNPGAGGNADTAGGPGGLPGEMADGLVFTGGQGGVLDTASQISAGGQGGTVIGTDSCPDGMDQEGDLGFPGSGMVGGDSVSQAFAKTGSRAAEVAVVTSAVAAAAAVPSSRAQTATRQPAPAGRPTPAGPPAPP